HEQLNAGYFREEPGAGKPHARICEGEAEWISYSTIPEFVRADGFEINALFLFHGALVAGSSSDAFSFNPTTGVLRRVGAPEDYIFAALLGLRPRTDTMEVQRDGAPYNLQYGEMIDACATTISVSA
ncbi:hypothetical protein, partial [Aurantimonas sp. A3-2-R12]|uniref:hypothetical protein n=1 Tax=Aurantimonas sp. A3-2-R12 TaxID=3114362 RepID=UPI002E190B90|nr:hypothetical protein [Aurantimonas sp. A3-2-R12]